MRIWTRAYRPWIHGGDVHQPIICDVDVTGPYEAGSHQLFIARSPNGTVFIAEGETGAIVGGDLAEVTNDIVAAELVVIEKQMIWARSQVTKTAEVTREEFWKLLRAD